MLPRFIHLARQFLLFFAQPTQLLERTFTSLLGCADLFRQLLQSFPRLARRFRCLLRIVFAKFLQRLSGRLRGALLFLSRMLGNGQLCCCRLNRRLCARGCVAILTRIRIGTHLFFDFPLALGQFPGRLLRVRRECLVAGKLFLQIGQRFGRLIEHLLRLFQIAVFQSGQRFPKLLKVEWINRFRRL